MQTRCVLFCDHECIGVRRVQHAELQQQNLNPCCQFENYASIAASTVVVAQALLVVVAVEVMAVDAEMTEVAEMAAQMAEVAAEMTAMAAEVVTSAELLNSLENLIANDEWHR